MKYLNRNSNESLLELNTNEDYLGSSCQLPEHVTEESMKYLFQVELSDAYESLLEFNSYEDYLSSSCQLPDHVVEESIDYLNQMDLLSITKNILLSSQNQNFSEEE